MYKYFGAKIKVLDLSEQAGRLEKYQNFCWKYQQ